MNKKIETTAILEQFETSLRDLAVLIGSYFEELKKQGVPEPLAFDLIKDWHYIYWSKVIPGAKDSK